MTVKWLFKNSLNTHSSLRLCTQVNEYVGDDEWIEEWNGMETEFEVFSCVKLKIYCTNKAVSCVYKMERGMIFVYKSWWLAG